VDFSINHFHWQFPERASTSRTSGLRFGRIGTIGWPWQKPCFCFTDQSSKTRFYNMLGKEDQSCKPIWVIGYAVGDREVGQCLDGSVILTLEIQQTFCAACKTGVNPELLDGLPMKPRPIDALLQWITLLQCPRSRYGRPAALRRYPPCPVCGYDPGCPAWLLDDRLSESLTRFARQC